jgi:hypothetical protein
MDRQWMKIRSWHIVGKVDEGKDGDSRLVTLCGLSRPGSITKGDTVSRSFPTDEKTCETCLRARWRQKDRELAKEAKEEER